MINTISIMALNCKSSFKPKKQEKKNSYLEEAKGCSGNFSRCGRHQEAHVVDQELGQIVRKEVLELVKDSSDGLK